MGASIRGHLEQIIGHIIRVVVGLLQSGNMSRAARCILTVCESDDVTKSNTTRLKLAVWRSRESMTMVEQASEYGRYQSTMRECPPQRCPQRVQSRVRTTIDLFPRSKGQDTSTRVYIPCVLSSVPASGCVARRKGVKACTLVNQNQKGWATGGIPSSSSRPKADALFS